MEDELEKTKTVEPRLNPNKFASGVQLRIGQRHRTSNVQRFSDITPAKLNHIEQYLKSHTDYKTYDEVLEARRIEQQKAAKKSDTPTGFIIILIFAIIIGLAYMYISGMM